MPQSRRWVVTAAILAIVAGAGLLIVLLQVADESSDSASEVITPDVVTSEGTCKIQPAVSRDPVGDEIILIITSEMFCAKPLNAEPCPGSTATQDTLACDLQGLEISWHSSTSIEDMNFCDGGGTLLLQGSELHAVDLCRANSGYPLNAREGDRLAFEICFMFRDNHACARFSYVL